MLATQVCHEIRVGKLVIDAGKVKFYALFHYVSMKTVQPRDVIDFSHVRKTIRYSTPTLVPELRVH